MAAVYGLGRTVYSHLFFEKCAANFTAETSYFPFFKMSFLTQTITKQDKETIDNRVKEVPESDKTVCRTANWYVDMKRKIGVVPESFAHLRTRLLCDVKVSCMHTLIASLFQDFSRICGRGDEGVAKHGPPKQCPDLDGPHFHRVSSTFHHHRPPNQTRVHFQTAHRIGVQKSTAHRTSHREDIFGFTKSANNRQLVTLTRLKWWLEEIRLLS